ncbi:hypothetical protein AAFN47_03525 [Hoeflea sp. CAU 1731]
MTTFIDRGTGKSRSGSMWNRIFGLPGRLRAANRSRLENEALLDMPAHVYRDIAIARGDVMFGVSARRRFVWTE